MTAVLYWTDSESRAFQVRRHIPGDFSATVIRIEVVDPRGDGTKVSITLKPADARELATAIAEVVDGVP